MSIPTRPSGGAAVPVKSSTLHVIGTTAIPVYEVAADAPIQGAPALPVVFISSSDLAQNGGVYHLDGRSHAMPISTKTGAYPVQGQLAIPVYLVNGVSASSYLLTELSSILNAENGNRIILE